MNQSWQVNVFGVRHLSPTGAWHLRRFLDHVRPELVLVEGLDDATELIARRSRGKGTKPPIALLAYTDTLPVRTLVYPLPGTVPSFRRCAGPTPTTSRSSSSTCPPTSSWASRIASKNCGADAARGQAEKLHRLVHGRHPEALRAGEPELIDRFNIYEQYRQPGRRARTTTRTGSATSSTTPTPIATAWPPLSSARGCVSWSRMNPAGGPRTWSAKRSCAARSRRPLRRARAERIVAIVGAFHAPVMTGEFPAMTDGELASLRRRASKFTLMPYSYFRLSSQSGYGAGNHAPAYFELLWEALEQDDLAILPAPLSVAGRPPHARGRHAPLDGRGDRGRTAGANTLAALKDGLAPALPTCATPPSRCSATESWPPSKTPSCVSRWARRSANFPKASAGRPSRPTSIASSSGLKLDKYRTTVQQELLARPAGKPPGQSRGGGVPRPQSLVLLSPPARPGRRLRRRRADTSQQSATWAEKWILAVEPGERDPA